MNTYLDRQQLCPTCKAKPGERCKTVKPKPNLPGLQLRKGIRVSYIHAARMVQY